MRTFSGVARTCIVAGMLGGLIGVSWVARDVGVAEAVGTKSFDLDTAERLGGGELKGTAITSNGELVAGWATEATPLVKGTSVWSSLELADGSVLLGCAPEGRVLKLDAQGKETVVAETTTLAVTAIARGPGGKVYAATIPEGEIFIVDPAQSVGVNPSAPAPTKPKAWTKLPSDHVWALAYDDKKGVLFAATGPDGKIYKIDAAGTATLFYTADDTQVVSLALAPNGLLYAGTSSKGLLLAIDAAGKAEVVNDFAGQEVKSIVFAAPAAPPSEPAKKGPPTDKKVAPTSDTLFVIVNEYPSPPEPPRRAGSASRMPSAASEPPRPMRSKGELWRVVGLDVGGHGAHVERLLRDDATGYVALAAEPRPHEGGPIAYVGTSNDARVIGVDADHGSAVLAKVDSRQVGAIGVGEHARWFAASDAGAFHRVKAIGGVESTWTSKALDAGAKASFGRLTWQASAAGGIELQTRTGNTAAPDPTWSEWSTPLPQPAKISSPAGRFVQLRARWKGAPTATLRQLSLAYATENQRAIVTEITVPTRLGAAGDTVTRASSLKLSWRVDNPDGDALRYRVWFRREDSTVWRPIVKEDEPISGTDFTWTTDGLAEGWYRVRVEATDELANPIGKGLKHAAESAPFVVDNTAPTITSMSLANGRLQAEVVDSIGPIARLEVQLDGRGPWRTLTSVDGILDDAKESVDTQLGITGSHVVALRAYDAAGNAVTREIEGR